MSRAVEIEGEVDARLLTAAAGLVLAAGLLQTGLEHLVDGVAVDPVRILRWRVLPAALWAAAAPLAILAASRWPVVESREEALAWRTEAAAGYLLAFVAWHLLVNLAIRLPDVPVRGAGWLVADTLEGAVAHAPAALALFLLLVVAGHGLRPRAGRSTSPTGSRPAPPARAAPLALPAPNRIHRVPPGEVRWVEADGDHVKVHGDRRTYRVRGTLRELEKALAPTGRFVRIHRSSLVHVDRVREVQPLRHGDWVAVLDDGTELRIPRTRRTALDRLRGRDAEAGG